VGHRELLAVEKEFPILGALVSAGPVYSGAAGFRIFAGRAIAGIDIDRLGYFAASVFWRAAAHRWSAIGKAIPASVRRMCMVRSPEGFLFTSEKMEEMTLAEMAKLVLRPR
jgi:hypothetical protein